MRAPIPYPRALRLLSALALMTALSACYIVPVGPRGGYDAGPVVVDGPPPPQYEVVPAAPGLGYVWIGGYWTWQLGRHAWVGGRWAVPPAGHSWVPHRWDRGSRGWSERPGYWQRGR